MHASGQRFDPAYLHHQQNRKANASQFCCAQRLRYLRSEKSDVQWRPSSIIGRWALSNPQKGFRYFGKLEVAPLFVSVAFL